MKFKNLLYLILFMILIACETGLEEVEKPNELKKQINEIKNFAKITDILIDENLGYNNFYIE